MNRRGAALVEFALMSLTIYLLVAAGIEFGRMVFISQVLQDAARVAAREFSVTQFPAEDTFEQALAEPAAAGIWDPNQLVVDMQPVHAQAVLDGISDDAELDRVFTNMPVVNRALRPAFIGDNPVIDGAQRRFLRYPGALLTTTATQFNGGFTVGVPRVSGRTAEGVETVEWVPVVSEVRANLADPACGTFSLLQPNPAPTDCGAGYDPTVARGIAAVAINYPFQSAMLSSFQKNAASAGDPLPPNVMQAFVADDGSVVDTKNPPPNLIDASRLPDPGTDLASGPYGGQFGLGIQRAFAKDVRPYRNLMVGQAMFRREVIAP